MIDHISILVTDVVKSASFYDAVLRSLGISRIMAYGATDAEPDHVGYGDGGKPYFWIHRSDATGGSTHVAFGAATRDEVDAFHRVGIAAGGRDNGAPGLRPQYHPGYYGAFILDADGNNVEAVHHGF